LQAYLRDAVGSYPTERSSILRRGTVG